MATVSTRLKNSEMTALRTVSLLAILFPYDRIQQACAQEYFDGKPDIAPIARFYDLPTRFLLKEELREVEPERFLQPEFLEVFQRALEGSYDNELHWHAAVSLQRVAREKMAASDKFVPSLRSRLQATSNRDVKRACAIALVEADSKEDAEILARLCTPSDEVLCSVIEPAIAEWKSTALLETWKNRIGNHHSFSNQLMSLACTGLAAIDHKDSCATLLELAGNDQVTYPTRKAAAEAAGTLRPKDSAILADELKSSSRNERILAVSLLKSAAADQALQLLEQLCDDSDNTVASTAWNTMVRQDPDRLLGRLKAGAKHADANVRTAVVEAIRLRPTTERCDLAHKLLADEHIDVRNKARMALTFLGESDETLYSHICNNAGEAVANSDSAWQQLEQCLLVLGRLRHDVFQSHCIPLLTHKRPEVFATSAWLLHLMPQDALGEAAALEANQKWSGLKSGAFPAEQKAGFSVQLGFLCHVAGYTRRKEAIDACRDQFNKGSGLSPESRAILLWSLGKIETDSDNQELAASYIERIFDDDPFFPEFQIVRCASALSLGLMNSHRSIPSLRKAHDMYGTGSPLGLCVSTALRMLGEDAPPPPKMPPVPIGNWPLQPSGLSK